MKAEEADQIARRIVNIWRSTPSLPEWRNVLEPLDYEAAEKALRELRDKQDGSLSIAQFKRTYRPPAGDTLNAPKRCELCSGTGWIEGESYTQFEHVYSSVKPCRCSRGHQARSVQEQIHGRTESAA